ncbi:Gag-Pol polyprotein/retrotransposon [Perilla frutescens var. hirtella]|nr:Gag-Pol polyprotein/retrotransposon [Perilla frutescens var. frutescens]KAH6794289.1 Gag-Pol polyprotein/retrotransposon [Perilla frutescens var. hirtella]
MSCISLSSSHVNCAVINLPTSPPSAARFLGIPFAAKTHLLRLCSATSGNANIPDSSGFDGSFVEKQGSNGKDDTSQAVSPKEILARLKRYGISGILSYGLLNTAYYLTTFLVVWFYVTPAPGKMGYLAAAERFLKVMAMVWAGSQVTKLMRAGGALALAPFVDRGLSWFTIKFGFESQGKAFMAIAGLCFGLAFLMFVIVTLLSA